MKLLALEFSSRRGSLALVEDGRLLAEDAWEQVPVRHEQLFERLPQLLRQAGLDLAELDSLVVGRGPGSFSGVRVAITAARLLALPRRLPVHAVSSGEALARQVLAETGVDRVVVVGDARRGSLWHGEFVRRIGRVEKTSDWALLSASALPEKTCIATSDWERLAASAAVGLNWIRESRYPSAARVAEAALDRLGRGLPSEPVEPVYLHPAV